MKASMSRRGNSFDIAPMEFFWEHSNSSLYIIAATEPDRRQFKITEYIEIFYNRQRWQARPGVLPPVAYLQKFYAGQLAV